MWSQYLLAEVIMFSDNNNDQQQQQESGLPCPAHNQAQREWSQSWPNLHYQRDPRCLWSFVKIGAVTRPPTGKERYRTWFMMKLWNYKTSSAELTGEWEIIASTFTVTDEKRSTLVARLQQDLLSFNPLYLTEIPPATITLVATTESHACNACKKQRIYTLNTKLTQLYTMFHPFYCNSNNCH